MYVHVHMHVVNSLHARITCEGGSIPCTVLFSDTFDPGITARLVLRN